MTTESDRELLELAAKAAGMWGTDFEIDDDSNLPIFDDVQGFRLAWGSGWWNPRTDDGDAFSLEAALRLDTTWGTASVTVGGCTERYSHGDDPREAKRRAITRAAASIGRGEG